ncbi:hypothetical protein Cgig2_010620 [Carnegiea gigantea]|uniref:Uncharacterized protein n=1 Tax=Carnegiea gigantea TaxID=171969 RepID=A0A9Q1GYM8_9CARY|nr:hypothetical protein Cgig2_010620 [Carnegiea gigantea]
MEEEGRSLYLWKTPAQISIIQHFSRNHKEFNPWFIRVKKWVKNEYYQTRRVWLEILEFLRTIGIGIKRTKGELLHHEDVSYRLVVKEVGSSIQEANNIKAEKKVDREVEETPKLKISHDNQKELTDMRTKQKGELHILGYEQDIRNFKVFSL